jgi:heme-degrading monooxygenase HmoA
MFARVTTITATPSEVEAATSSIREQVEPAISRAAGFAGLVQFLDRTSGKLIVATLWESEEAMLGSDALGDQLRAAVGTRVRARPTVERFEVSLTGIKDGTST